MSSATADRLLGRLAGLLEWHGLGSAALTPRPRGGRLTGEDAAEVAALLDQLTEADAGLQRGQSPRSLIFGNGCFAIGRYAEAYTVYLGMAAQRPDDFAVRFNLGVTCLRRRKAGRGGRRPERGAGARRPGCAGVLPAGQRP